MQSGGGGQASFVSDIGIRPSEQWAGETGGETGRKKKRDRKREKERERERHEGRKRRYWGEMLRGVRDREHDMVL